MNTFRDWLWLNLRWLSGTMAIFLVFLMLTLFAMYGVVQIGAMEDRLLATEHEIFPEAGHFKAGAGFVYCGGKQFFGQNTTAANWCFEKVHANASTPTVLYTFPPPVANEQHSYGATIEERCDEADAAVSLDGGTCAATVRRYVTGELVGGAFCTSQGVCATGTSTAIDVSVDPTQFAPGGVLATCIPTIVWNGTALEVLAPSCPVGTYNSGWATGFHSKDLTDAGTVDSGPADASDSGADAADAADASDSGADGGTDSGGGGARTVSAVCPFTVLPAGSPITITGTGFQSGDVPVVSGSNCTSTTVVSSTKITCTTPALTQTASGATPGDVVVAGSATSAASKVGVEPSSTTYAIDPCVANTTIATGVSALTDVSGAYTLSQATGGNQPALSTASFGGQYGLLFTSGQKLVNTTIPQIASAPYSVFAVIAAASLGSPSSPFLGTGTTVQPNVALYNSGYAWFTNSSGTYAIQAGPSSSYDSYSGNMLGWIIDGSSSLFYLDGTSEATTITTATGTWGAGLTLGTSLAGTIGHLLVTSNHISNTDRVDHQWLMHYFYGTAYP